jgi:translation initiation factor IF-3
MAREANLDLVEVAPTARPPVCRIMDYGKWRYQQQKKEDKSRASNRGGQLKELKLRTVRIGEHDLQIKIDHAREFLKEGNKVQFTLQFKGREMAHLELGRDLFIKVKEALFLVSKIERDARMEGRRMTLVLQPDHKNPATAAKAAAAARPGAARAKTGTTKVASPMTAGSSLNIPTQKAAIGANAAAGDPSAIAVAAPTAAPAASTASAKAAVSGRSVAASR